MAEKSLTLRLGAKGVTATESALNRINKQIGAGSPLGKLGGAALGTGIVAGVTYLTRALEQSAARAEDVVTAFRLGEKSAGEMTEELLKSLPVLGSIIKSGQSIREIITGQLAEAKRITQDAERLNKILDARAALMKASADSAAEFHRTLREIIRDFQLLGATESQKGTIASIRKLEETFRKLDADLAKRIETIKTNTAEGITAATAAVEAARQQVPSPYPAWIAAMSRQRREEDLPKRNAEIAAAQQKVAEAEGKLLGLIQQRDRQIRAETSQARIVGLAQFGLSLAQRIEPEINAFREFLRDPLGKIPSLKRILSPVTWERFRASLDTFDRLTREEAQRVVTAARANLIRRHEEQHQADRAETSRMREERTERSRGPMFSPITEERFTTGAGAAARERFGLGIDATTTAVNQVRDENKKQTKIQEELRRTMEQVLEQIRNPQEIFGDI